nr:DUF4981 domain-containing protein [Eubacterium sp.]
RFLFTDVSAYKCKWRIDCEGEELQSGETEKLALLPLQEEIIDIPYDYSALPTDRECVLTVSFHTKKKTPGLKAGAEVAFDQFILTSPSKPKLETVQSSLSFEKNKNCVTVIGSGFSVKIENGALVELIKNGNSILTSPLRPCYFRAMTDNDIDVLNFAPPLIHFNPYYKWQKATKAVKALKTEVEQTDGIVKIKAALEVPNLKNAYISYTVYPDSRIAVYHSAVIKADLHRFGCMFEVDKSYDSISWYGRGPEPCYPDRKTGSKIGLYSMPLGDFEYNYMRPQEASSRADVRYFTLENKRGEGIKITAYYDKPVLFSALPYTPDMLESFTHIKEINRDNGITVTVDSAQQGVGGDMPGQACVRDKYKIKAGEKLTLSFLIEVLG